MCIGSFNLGGLEEPRALGEPILNLGIRAVNLRKSITGIEARSHLGLILARSVFSCFCTKPVPCDVLPACNDPYSARGLRLVADSKSGSQQHQRSFGRFTKILTVTPLVSGLGGTQEEG
ncbi:hypothetical protein EVAR_79909_1 [Eumeta japonica]|uniref:Uncharacterized protein n=1 Tax=Eumeta variegata TaxID=151549 RepID=A0A4C1TZ26_EUMVA|nr:hypothetical protein EVAR_79909_1 [Eumeta japonica]